MRVAIIGAGLTSLSAGYYLSKRGVQVEIFEKESVPGGLTAGFKKESWLWPLENFFHHLFVTDKELFYLADELGVRDKIFFRRPITSVFYNDQISFLDSPVSLLKFPHLSLPEKLRMGAALASFKFNPFWGLIEKTTAADLLPKLMGKKSYQILWQPLFEGKFGKYANQVCAAWFQARIKKRSPKLGYFQGGFQTLIDALVKEINKNGGQIHLASTINNIHPDMAIAVSKSTIKFDKVLVTAPIPVFLKIAPKLNPSYLGSLENLRIIGAINVVLELKEPFLADGTYWLNINDSSSPFCAVVEHTNFINPKYYGGNYVLYVGGYYPQGHPYFKFKKERIIKEFLPYLQKINPDFSFRLSLISSRLSQSLYAQPIIPINYSQIKPSITTPTPNLYLATLHHIYPWDRGVNYAIELGGKATNEILKYQR